MSTTKIKRAIKSRKDLSFTNFESGGSSSNWSVSHDKEGYWSNGIVIGTYLFAEVAALAEVDESEAFSAIQYAMNCPGWSSLGWGIETGFSKELAAAAIVGLRALRHGATEFDYEAIERQMFDELIEAEKPKKAKKEKAE